MDDAIRENDFWWTIVGNCVRSSTGGGQWPSRSMIQWSFASSCHRRMILRKPPIASSVGVKSRAKLALLLVKCEVAQAARLSL